LSRVNYIDWGPSSRANHHQTAPLRDGDSHYVSVTITLSDGDYGAPYGGSAGARESVTRNAQKICGDVRTTGPARSSVLQPGPAVCPVRDGRSDQFVAGVTCTVAYELSFAVFRMVIETP
jgi:hypothetical protein